MPQKNLKISINKIIQTYQILTKNDEVCIPSHSSILLAVLILTKLNLSKLLLLFVDGVVHGPQS